MFALLLLCFPSKSILFNMGLFNLYAFIIARFVMFVFVSVIYVVTGDASLVQRVRSLIITLIIQLIYISFVFSIGVSFAVVLILLLI